jgi:hypothetical protein
MTVAIGAAVVLAGNALLGAIVLSGRAASSL